MKKIINIQSNQNEDINYNVKDLTIDQIVPNIIDNFIITIFEDHHTIVLPHLITGVEFKAWSRGKGGIFSKDVLKYSLNKKSAQYVSIKGENMHCIARLIEEEEKELFETLNLIDGKINDVSYMILKNISEDEKLTSTKNNLNENNLDIIDTDMAISLNVPKLSQEDDIDYKIGSISLFTD